MNLKNRMIRIVCPTVMLAGLIPMTSVFAEDGYGTLTGKFVLEGAVPKPEFLIKAGKLVGSNAAPKNPVVCAAKDLPSDALVVDAKGKGIGNIFVYLRKAPPKIHPALVKPPAKKLVLDQIGCQFVPHSLVVRAGQTVLVKSDDACSHNFHTYPLRNEPENFVIPAKFRKGVPLTPEVAELLPMKVTCDIHTWMRANWLILDHPYAAATVANVAKGANGPAIGTFKIEKLPYGTYEFRVWHEKAGYIGVGTKRGFKVTINKATVKLDPFKVPVDTFE